MIQHCSMWDETGRFRGVAKIEPWALEVLTEAGWTASPVSGDGAPVWSSTVCSNDVQRQH